MRIEITEEQARCLLDGIRWAFSEGQTPGYQFDNEGANRQTFEAIRALLDAYPQLFKDFRHLFDSCEDEGRGMSWWVE